MTIYVNTDEGPETTPLGAMEPSFGASFKASVQETFAGNPATLLYEFDKLYGSRWTGANAGKKVDRGAAEQQIKAAGVKLSVPDEGYTQSALDMLIQRKQDQIERQSVIDRTPWSWLGSPARGAGMLLAGAVDPLNVASAFIPVVGEARVASMLGRAGESAFARAGVRAGVGAIEGAVGAAALEPLVFGLHSQFQDDYSMADSLTNLAFGAVLGAGLHVVGGAVADTFRPRALPRAVADAVETIGRTDRTPLQTLQTLTPETAQAQAITEIRAEVEAFEQRADAAATPEAPPTRIERPAEIATPEEMRQIDAGQVPERFIPRVEQRARELLNASIEAGKPLPAAGVAQAATPDVRDAAMRAAVSDVVQGRTPDVGAVFTGNSPEELQARLARQQQPESLAVGAPQTAQAATARLEQAPQDIELETAQAQLTEVMPRAQAVIQNLEAAGFPPAQIQRLREGLKALDEGVAEAEGTAKALEAIALCQVRQ